MHIAPRQRVRYALLAAVVICASCAVPEEVPVEGARLDLLLADGHLTLVAGEPTPLLAHPDDHVAASTDLTWTFVDRSGTERARGSVADPRLVHYEPLAGEEVADVLRAPAGAIRLEVPDVEGTVTVRDAAGDTVGRLSHVPLGGVAFSLARADGKADINFETDLIGGPVLMAGDGEPTRHINLMIVPEGYTQAQLAKFHDDARAMLATLLDTDGYREHKAQINAWMQDIKSAQSGISDPATHTTKRTAFDITFGDGQSLPRRCLMPSKSWNAVSVGNMLRLGQVKNADTVIVLANVAEYSGCANYGGGYLVMSNHVDAKPGLVLAHELGHALFDLGDEYVEAGRECDSSRPNLSAHLDQLPWRDLIAHGTPLPTPVGQSGNPVGAYEGGGYCMSGVYRPQATCRMRELANPFCAVCRREVDRRFQHRATAVSRATITNRTGMNLWLLCDGHFGTPACSGWTQVAPDATAELALSEGRFLFNSSSPALVSWNGTRLDAPSEQFSIYANAADPFRAEGMSSDAGVVVGEDAGTGAGECTVADLVINEVQTGGATAADEFVELYNGCDAAVDLSGVRVVYRSGTATSDSAILGTLADSIAAGGTYVLGSTVFGGAARTRFASGIGAARGGVGLRDGAGALVDAVAWGSVSNGFAEGASAAAAPARSSIARTPDGHDSQDNAHDFVVDATPTPGAAN